MVSQFWWFSDLCVLFSPWLLSCISFPFQVGEWVRVLLGYQGTQESWGAGGVPRVGAEIGKSFTNDTQDISVRELLLCLRSHLIQADLSNSQAPPGTVIFKQFKSLTSPQPCTFNREDGVTGVCRFSILLTFFSPLSLGSAPQAHPQHLTPAERWKARTVLGNVEDIFQIMTLFKAR